MEKGRDIQVYFRQRAEDIRRRLKELYVEVNSYRPPKDTPVCRVSSSSVQMYEIQLEKYARQECFLLPSEVFWDIRQLIRDLWWERGIPTSTSLAVCATKLTNAGLSVPRRPRDIWRKAWLIRTTVASYTISGRGALSRGTVYLHENNSSLANAMVLRYLLTRRLRGAT